VSRLTLDKMYAQLGIHARMKGPVVPTDASAQRLRVGAELRRLREHAGLAGEQVARELGWSQPKVSRIEIGRTTFTLKDVTALLALYGVADDVRAELLAAAAQETGETAWVVRAGGYPRRQGTIATLESATKRIRQYQPVVVPGLLQTRDYARLIAKAAGATDPDAIADARMRRQEILSGKVRPRYEVVLDARATLLRPGPVEVVRNQVIALAARADQPSVNLRVIPIGALSPVFAAAGFNLYDFRAAESPSVAWIESPTGDTYFSAPEDIERYATLFRDLQSVALDPKDSVEYLRSLAVDVERYMGSAAEGGNQK
jgi:transcriptional regulator with XRE-family HTH domain